MPTTKIFVGNIALGTSSAELRDLFSSYGQVTECDVLGAGNYAFVHMASEDEVELAVTSLHNYVFNGSSLNVERSTSETQGRKRKEAAANFRSSAPGHSGIPKRNTTKIFVGNIKDGTTNDELRTLFEEHGIVSEADVCGGFGFVHMQSQADAIKAIKSINGYYLNGNRLNVELSTSATQGRSSVPVNPSSRGGGRGGFGRGRGNPLQAGKRFDPYNKVLSGSTYRAPLAPDPYTGAVSYGYGLDPYAVGDFSAESYGSASQALAPSASGLSSDSFARNLLNLYINNPAAFDQFAKNPAVQQDMNLTSPGEPYDPYYRPPKEYYEAKNPGLLPMRSAGLLDDGFGNATVDGYAVDSYAPVPKRPLLPIGSGRGLAGIGMPPRGPPMGPVPLVGYKPVGLSVVRPRAAAIRPAALYMSFE